MLTGDDCGSKKCQKQLVKLCSKPSAPTLFTLEENWIQIRQTEGFHISTLSPKKDFYILLICPTSVKTQNVDLTGSTKPSLTTHFISFPTISSRKLNPESGAPQLLVQVQERWRSLWFNTEKVNADLKLETFSVLKQNLHL